MERGREIQQDFLPSDIPNLPNWEIATCFYPAKEVSGNSNPRSIERDNRELEVVRLTNNYLVRHHGQEGMFATLFFAVLDPFSGHLVYINGGHEPLYVIGKDGVKEELPPMGPAVGLMENFNFKAQWLQLDPGDLLLGFTDGALKPATPKKSFSAGRG